MRVFMIRMGIGAWMPIPILKGLDIPRRRLCEATLMQSLASLLLPHNPPLSLRGYAEATSGEARKRRTRTS